MVAKLKLKGIDGRAPISSVNCRIQSVLDLGFPRRMSVLMSDISRRT